MARAVVLGGGFGGIAAAHELRRILPADDEVTLIASRDHFYVGFAKLWDLVGARKLSAGTRPLTALAAHGIEFVHDEAVSIDPKSRAVETRDGRAISGDGLIVALGAGYAPAHAAMFGGGVHNLYDATALPDIRAALEQLERGTLLVSILGGPYLCPPAPFEAALLLDEQLRQHGRRDDVDLVVSAPQPITLPVAGPDASRYLADELEARGVSVLTDHPIASIDAAAGRTTFKNGASVDWQLCLGVPAASPPPVLATSGLVGESGWIEPDPRTFATAFDGVWAVGDCTQVPTATAQLPKAGVFAEAGGIVAARNLAASLQGGDGDRFDGHGYCFLELPGQQVAKVEGDFYAEPRPDVALSAPSAAAFAAKQAWEEERLSRWFG